MDTSPNIPRKRSQPPYLKSNNTQRRLDQSRASRQPAHAEGSSKDVSDRGDRATLRPSSSGRSPTASPRVKAIPSITTTTTTTNNALSRRNNNDSSSSPSSSRSHSTSTSTPVEQQSFEWHGQLEPPDTAGGIATMDVHIQSIAGRAPHAPRVKEMLNRLSTSNKLQIRSFLALNILQRFFSQSASIMMMTPGSTGSVQFAKCRSFLTINRMAALILRPSKPSEVLAVIPHSETMEKGWRLKDAWLPHNMLVIYLPSIPPEPPLLKGYLDLDVFANTTPGQSFEWQTMTLALKFPVELLEEIKRDTFIVVCGHSKWAAELRQAYYAFKAKKIDQTRRKVILLDRYQDCRFQRDLSIYKQSRQQPSFWEFGICDLDTPKIPPVKRIFPEYTGGFITTNLENILEKPTILDTIADTTRRLNLNPANGEWKFVLSDDILVRLSRRMDSQNASQVRIALLHLKTILVCNECELVHDWAEETQGEGGVEPTPVDDSAVSLMERLLRQCCYSRQNFVIVDDIASRSPKRLRVIEKVPSWDLYKAFSMEQQSH